MGRPHDSFFHFTFAQADCAESLLRGLLPDSLVPLLAGAELQLAPAKAAGTALRLHEGDLLFLLRIGLVADPLFVLLEHKSYRDPGLLRQLLRYGVHLTEAWLQAHRSLPHVLSIVVHHGRLGMAALSWRPPAALRRVPVELRSFDPHLEVVCIDLTCMIEAGLRARVLVPLACLTLLCLQHLPRRDRAGAAAALERWGDLIGAVEAGHRGQIAMEQLSSYVLCVTELTAEELDSLIKRILQKPTASYVMSTANKLRSEGKIEGRTEALAEAQTRLLRQLAARFASVPAELEARVRRGTSADLDNWSIRLLQAKSVFEVFAGE